MFCGEHDANNAILTIHAGAGGTEAQDWVSMLMRMYLRWAEAKSFKADILDYLAGDEAGVKSVAMMIKGKNAYGLLRDGQITLAAHNDRNLSHLRFLPQT